MIEYRVLKEVYDDMISGNKDTEIRLLTETSAQSMERLMDLFLM